MKLTDEELALARRALVFWVDSEKQIPSKDTTVAPKMRKLIDKLDGKEGA